MATPMWIGGAPVVEHVGTITIANTWAANDTLTVTINGKVMQLTIGTAAATTDVATALQAAWEGTTLGTGYVVNFEGTEAAEFYELIATVSGSVVTLTERAAANASGFTEGKTFTIAAGETTAGTGTATYATTTSPTGPHHWDNVANWSTGVVATDTDVISFTGSTDCRYAIDRSSAITSCTLHVLGSFTGQLGLPRLRSVTMPDAQVQTYEEYRDQYFKVSTGGTVNLYVGYGEGDGPTLVCVDANTALLSSYIDKTGEPEDDALPVVFIKNGAATSDTFVTGGKVGLAFWPDETATHDTLMVSQSEDGDDTEVICGIGYSLSGADMTVASGTVTHHGVTTTDSIRVGASGTLTLTHKAGGTIAALKVLGGTVNMNCAATVTAGHVTNGGTLNLADGVDTLTFTNLTLYQGATLLMNALRQVTYSNGVTLAAGVKHDDVTLPTELIANAAFTVKTTSI